MTKTTWGRTAPPCTDGKRHQWRKGNEQYGESGVCARCGYDVFEERYR